MWTPTHVIVTVLRARNLLEKGKGGNDAYCMIGMGKEKFLTSVKPKSTMPQWDEQAEFALGEREDLKITVYHKSSIIDEFIGRIVINVSELSFEHNKSFVTWYKLLGKEKSESNKKPDKERGEVEVRIEFVVRSKTGSMMDLSMKSKENSLSLRNLKDKSFNIKHSLGDKFKILNPMSRRSSKFAGENQLAEQSKRMGGSKLDFLEGEDVASLTSSYSSINGPTLNRNASAGGQMNSLNRFNPARASFISKTSSKMDNDGNSSANGGADFTHNEDDFNDDPDSESAGNVNSSFSQRRNSSRFGPSARQLSKRSSTGSSQQQQAPSSSSANEAQSQLKITNPFGSDFGSSDIPATTNEEEDSTSPVSETPSGGAKSIHIAPLPPFTTTTAPTTSTPTMSKRGQAAESTSSSGSSGSSHAMGKPTTTTIEKPPVPSPRDHRKSSHHNRHELVNSTIDEENTLSSIKNVSSSQRGDKSRDHQATMDSFESSFATTNSSANPAIIATATSTNLIKSSNDSGNASIIKSNDEGKPSQQTLSNPSRSTLTKTASESSASSLSDEPAMKPPQEHKKKAPLPPSSSQSPPPLPQLPTHQQPVTKKNSAAKIIDATAAILPPPEQYSDQALPEPKATTASASKLSSTADDQIDWESSDDDEIVKREIETFERHQAQLQQQAPAVVVVDNFTPLIPLASDTNSSQPPATTTTVDAFFDPFDSVFDLVVKKDTDQQQQQPTKENFKDLFSDLFTDLYPPVTLSNQSPVLNRIEENVAEEEETPAPPLRRQHSRGSAKKPLPPTSLVVTSDNTNSTHQQLPKRGFPSEKIFSIDIDPFSSSSSSSSLTSSPLSSPVKEEIRVDQQQQLFDTNVDSSNTCNSHTNPFVTLQTPSESNVDKENDSFAYFSNLKTIEEISDFNTKMSEAELEIDQGQTARDAGSPLGSGAETQLGSQNENDTMIPAGGGGGQDSGVMSQDFDENLLKSSFDNFNGNEQQLDVDTMYGGHHLANAESTGHHLITAVPPVTFGGDDDENGDEFTVQAQLKKVADEMSDDEDYQAEPPVSKLQSRAASVANGTPAISIQDPFAQISAANLSQSPGSAGQNQSRSAGGGPSGLVDSDAESANEDLDMDNAFDSYRSAPSKPSQAVASKTSDSTFDEALREANEQRERLAELGLGIDDADFNNADMDLTLDQSDNTTALFKNRLNLTNTNDDDDLDSATALTSESPFTKNRNLRQSERRRLMPTEDLTSDLKSEADFNVDSASLRHQNHLNRVASFKSSAAQPPSNLISVASSNRQRSNETLNNRQSNPFNEDEEIKTPDFDYRFQTADQGLDDTKKQSQLMNGHETAGARKSGLPDLVNQKDGSSNDKAKKYLEDLDGVKFNDVQVPDTLKKQLEYFDREELLQLIAYQKKYLDYKESRIKDLENYIDNLVVKIIETEPLILMNASNVLNKSRNLI